MPISVPTLKNSCNKEIFLVYNDEKNDEGIPVKICIMFEFMDLIDHLKKLIPNIDCETKILHGVLTQAFNLPKNLRGKTAFIIINSSSNALIMETDSTSDKDLALTITSILTNNNPNFIPPLKIENIYILYGYEITTVLSLDEEEIDEEIINTCQKIANDVQIIGSLTHPK